MDIRTFTQKLALKYKQLGLIGLLCFIYKKFRSVQPTKHDVLSFYDYILPHSFGQTPPPAATSINEITVNWLIPNFGLGSGGHLNIFRMITNLEALGVQCRIIIVENSHYPSAKKARADICKHFSPVKAEVSIGRDSMKPAHITIATGWQTAYAVRDFQATRHKCYFVQDFEPFFYAPGSEYIFAENTYKLGFHGITAGKWLSDKLSQEYGMNCDWFEFSYERELYRVMKKKQVSYKKVFFYARPVTPRRGFELGLMVLAEVAKRMPDTIFVLAGWDTSGYDIPFKHANFGVVALEKLSEVYNDCDAALVLSFTNLSLLPLELMACGCPVVSNKGANVEWALNEENCMLAETDVLPLANALTKVLTDDKLSKEITEKALRYVEGTSWQKSAKDIATVFAKLENING